MVMHDNGDRSCQVINPGDTTYLDDVEDFFCPGFERVNLKKSSHRIKKEKD